MKITSKLNFNKSFIFLSASLFFSAILGIYQPKFISNIENIFNDIFIKIAASKAQENRIAIIDIDERSLNEIGPWPWPRTTIADLVELALIDLKSTSIGIDIIFPHKLDDQGDKRLATLAEVAPVTFSYILDYENRDNIISTGFLPKNNFSATKLKKDNSIQAYGHISNHIGLMHAKCAGNIGYIPDPDGKIRSLPASSFYQGKFHPLFSQAVLNCAGIFVDIPDYLNPKWKLKYSTALNSFFVISATDILNHRIPKDLFENKHVLIGSSSLALGDRVSTPLAPLAPGVAVHAAAIIDLLNIHDGNKTIRINGQYILILFCILCIFFIWLSIKRKSPWISVLTIIVLCLSWIIISFASKILFNIDNSITSPIIGLILVSLFVLPQEWWNVKKTEIKLKKNFSSYVGKSVLYQLISSNSEDSLKPSLRDITVLVVDMQGYTRRVMSLPIEDSASLTREFLTRLTKPIINNQGTLDKYMGDGLLAFWGAPLPTPKQADLAISCAIEILQSIDAWNKENAYTNKNPIRVRIGIESGYALVGDLGTNFRSTYTAVGDCINIASRLEALAKELTIPIAIGPNAKKRSERNDLVCFGNYQLRDTENTIEIFTISSYIVENKSGN